MFFGWLQYDIYSVFGDNLEFKSHEKTKSQLKKKKLWSVKT